MKNIEYLEAYFRKHKLSGKIKVKFSSPSATDDTMSDIVFENGDVITINDVIFDIESDFPEDVVTQWMEEKRKNDISLVDWIQSNTHYMPKDIDRTSVIEYQNELTSIVDDIKKNINSIFQLDTEEGDSDEESEDE